MMFRVALLVAMIVGSMATYYGGGWNMPYRRHYGGGMLYGGYGGGYGGLAGGYGGGYGGFDPYYNMGYNSYYGNYEPYHYGGGSYYNRPGRFGKGGRY